MFGFGGRQNHHTNILQRLIAVDLCQQFQAVFFRQIQIEEDEIRSRCIGVFSFLLEKGHCFHTILDDAEVIRHLGVFQDLPCKANIARIVFDQ